MAKRIFKPQPVKQKPKPELDTTTPLGRRLPW